MGFCRVFTNGGSRKTPISMVFSMVFTKPTSWFGLDFPTNGTAGFRTSHGFSAALDPWKQVECQIWKGGVSENSVPINHPMVLLIIIPTKWLFHWGYTPFSDIPICRRRQSAEVHDHSWPIIGSRMCKCYEVQHVSATKMQMLKFIHGFNNNIEVGHGSNRFWLCQRGLRKLRKLPTLVLERTSARPSGPKPCFVTAVDYSGIWPVCWEITQNTREHVDVDSVPWFVHKIEIDWNRLNMNFFHRPIAAGQTDLHRQDGWNALDHPGFTALAADAFESVRSLEQPVDRADSYPLWFFFIGIPTYPDHPKTSQDIPSVFEISGLKSWCRLSAEAHLVLYGLKPDLHREMLAACGRANKIR